MNRVHAPSAGSSRSSWFSRFRVEASWTLLCSCRLRFRGVDVIVARLDNPVSRSFAGLACCKVGNGDHVSSLVAAYPEPKTSNSNCLKPP